jgi:uncharacterized protein (TIGR02147 family)
MVLECQNYREILRAQIVERCRKNPKFSLRAFAKLMAIPASNLSEILNGKKNISVDRAYSIAEKLRFTTKERDYFVSLVQIETTKSESSKMALMEKVRAMNPKLQMQSIAIDHFKVISEWFHFAILELLQVEAFDFSVKRASKALGVSGHQVEIAVARLQRLGLIEQNENGKYIVKNADVLVQSSIPAQALRDFHRQMLTKTAESIENQSPQEKIIGTETLAFDSDDLNEADKAIEECFQKIIALSRKSRSRNSVYHLGIQFFNLTKESST